ncbi:MAG TPA: NAD(P)/FAD-dependent oxidoreductase [Gemmatimonadaceae bacterium]|nr:NAD(P)/FAD-dependent oxidoreductase [Gemmatimonadaceae bacterium]
MTHVGIVGGGMLGLGLARRLKSAGCDVTVIESAPRIGGLASAQQIGPVTWDRFYHVTLLSDATLRELLGELQLADSIQWRTTRTGFFTDGVLYPFNNALDFLRFPPLNLIDKVRLGLTILTASRIVDGQPLERELAVDWLTRLSGSKTVERIWLPLLKAKLGANATQASASFIWAIIARMYAARRSGLKQEMFGYVQGGYDAVLTRLEHYLTQRGVELVTGQPVENVETDSDGATVKFGDGTTRRFDAVVMTVPCSRITAMCPQLTDDERARLNRVVYQGIICPSILLDRPLAPYYVTNITDDWVPFTAVIEMTALVDPATFGGKHLVYLPRYLTQTAKDWGKSDEEILDESISALERMYPHFHRGQVRATQVARVRNVLAVTTRDYTANSLPPLKTSQERLFVVNSAQIANGTLNVNETLMLADRQARELAPLLAASPPAVKSQAVRS